MRWDEKNAYCLCASCHRFWHENPTESGDWARKKMGEAAYAELRQKAESVKKWTDKEGEELLETLCQR